MSIDVYANAFVPQWLRDINEAPAQLVFATTPTDFEIPFEEYTRTFAGTSLLSDKHLSLDSPPETAAPPAIGKSSHVLPQPSSYRRLFHKALADEFRSLQTAQKAFNLSQVRTSSITLDPAGTFVTAQLPIPGLRENSPFVRLGDVVTIRPLCLDQLGNPVAFQQFPGQTAFYFPVLGWNGTEFQSIVTSINRHHETISLKIDNPAAFEPYHRGNLNISFPIRASWATSQYLAVQKIEPLLQTSQEKNWTQKMLFPTPSDGINQVTLNPPSFNLTLFNASLNYEQQKAINAIFSHSYGTLPFLISGPPGTGKTMTTVEAALQLLHKVRHIIVCAPSDPAADTLAQRLKTYLQDPFHLFRLNAPSRTFAEVPESLMPYCYIEDRCFGLPPFKMLMNYKVVVTTCRDADMLVRARLTNSDLFELEENLVAVLHPEDASSLGERALHWGALFIDEAAQATEPEALIPLTVVAPPVNYKGREVPQVVMVGDHKQLGPRTASTVGIIKTSLFERLLQRPAYSQHPLSRGRKSAMHGLTQAMLPIKRPPFCDLIRNYRSHPAILAIPNSLFYHDTLLAEAADTNSLLPWPGWKVPRWPVQFTCNIGQDELEQDGGGWYNKEEARKACVHALSFLQSGLIRQEEICIMSPFQAQVRHLRIMFRNVGLGSVNIGPMEAFQGLESRLVILCTTRARTRFMDQDAARGLGIINESKRFNVALTRAKQGLIVIGNPDLLAMDPLWVSFLEFCKRNKLWEASDVGIPNNGNWSSAPMHRTHQAKLPILERILSNVGVDKSEERQLGTVMYHDDAMWAYGLHDALPSEQDHEEEMGAGALFIDEDEEEEKEATSGVIKVQKLAESGNTKPTWANIANIAAFHPQSSAK